MMAIFIVKAPSDKKKKIFPKVNLLVCNAYIFVIGIIQKKNYDFFHMEKSLEQSSQSHLYNDDDDKTQEIHSK